MDIVARLVVVALVVLPLVVLALRGTRRDPLAGGAGRSDAAHDDLAALTAPAATAPADADARRLQAEHTAIAAHAAGEPAQPPAWSSRPSADSASWIAASSSS